jgi:RNA processing factor Prp31
MFEVEIRTVNNPFKPELVESTTIVLRQKEPFVQMSYRYDQDFSQLSDEEAIQKVLDDFYSEHYNNKIQESKLTKLELEISHSKEREKETSEQIQQVKVYTDEQEIEVKQRTEEVAHIVANIVQLDDLMEEQKESYLGLYPEWQTDKSYEINEVIRYESTLYKVVQAHTSQSDWLPSEVDSLYTELRNDTIVDEDTGEETEIIDEFVQPEGAHDAYMTGDKVEFEGDIYESTIDNNVYSPSDYPQGWEMI